MTTKAKGKRQKIRNLNKEIIFFSSVDCCTSFTAGRLLAFRVFSLIIRPVLIPASAIANNDVTIRDFSSRASRLG